MGQAETAWKKKDQKRQPGIRCPAPADPLTGCPRGLQACELRPLFEASQKINLMLPLGEILRAIIEAGTAVTHGSRAALWEYDQDQQLITAQVAVGFRPEAVAEMAERLAESGLEQVIRQREPLWISETRNESGLPRPLTEAEGVRSFLHIPLQIERELFGIFHVSRDQPWAISEHEWKLLTTFANLAATAIRNDRLYETLQVRSDALEQAIRDLRESRRQCEASYRQLLATQSQLIQAEKMATLGRLAAGIAHEIKTPLAGIRGAIEVLRDDFAEQQDPRHPVLEEVVRQIARLNESVAEFLRFVRPARPQLQWTNVNDVVDSVCSLLQTQAARHHAHLFKEYEDGDVAAWLDPDQIRQVLLNMGVNALEALGDSGGQVVFTTARPPEGDLVVLTVADTGCGMSPEVLAEVFAPYFTTKSTGTGLGLAIAQRIIVEHGGQVAVESEEGQGTCFTLILPVDRNRSGMH
jgi:signal transduction histidine kinase